MLRAAVLGANDGMADELSAGDVLSAHARDELGMTELSHARPFQAASASAASFTVDAALPLLSMIRSPAATRIELTVAATVVALDLTGFIGARLGGAPARPGHAACGDLGCGGDGADHGRRAPRRNERLSVS